MTLNTREIGDVTVVDVTGRITVQEGWEQFRDLTRTLQNDGRMKLVLNLQQVPYIDSTALGEIIRTYTSVIRHNGSVKLLHVNAHVHQLLVITSLLSVFDLFDSEADAVKSFGKATAQ